MTDKSKKIIEEALALPEKERTEVVEHLLNSIEHPSPALTDDELKAVVARRSAELDEGKVRPVSLDEVKDRIRASTKIHE